jgi:hypothetical protein
MFFEHKRLILILPRQYGGKTEIGCRFGIDLTSRPFTKSSLFLAKDHPSAKKATREKYIRMCDPKVFSVNTAQVYLKKHPTSTLYIGSVDKEPDKLRGGTYAYVHWSEVAFSKIERGETIMGVYDKVVQPTLEMTDGYVLLETTLNGKNGFHDLYCHWRDNLKLPILHVSLYEMAVLGFITWEQYDAAKAKYHPDVFKQEFECEWVSFKGKTYPEADGSHIDPNMPDPTYDQTIVFAIDWGFRPSATCVLFAYVKNGVINVFDEHYEMEEGPLETSRAINNRRIKFGCRMVGVADHDLARNKELTSRGIEAAPADKLDVMGNRMSIKEAFYFGTLKIHPRCVNLLKDLDAAAWDDKKDGEIDYDACTWGHFDAEAALRYLVRKFSELKDEDEEKSIVASFDQSSAQASAFIRSHSDDY